MLTDAEREALDEALWGGRIYDDVPAVVEQIKRDAVKHVMARIQALADEWDKADLVVTRTCSSRLRAALARPTDEATP